MKSARRIFYLSLGGLLLLVGCAAVTPRPPVSDDAVSAWQARRDRLGLISEWNLRARLALRHGQDGAQVTLRWERHAGRDTMDLAGPFGGGRVLLTRDRTGVTLRDAKQQTQHDTDASALLYRLTGWLLPLDRIEYWMRGLPAPGSEMTYELDEHGRIAYLQQSGWDVHFLAYGQYNGHELPVRLIISHNPLASANASPPEFEARLVLEQFLVGGE